MARQHLRDIDRGFDRILREFKRSSRGVEARIGIQAPEASVVREGGATNVQIGVAHEFGVAENNLPERSFLRSTADKNKGEYARLVQGLLSRFVDGRSSIKQVVGAVGEKVSSDVKGLLTDGVAPALSAARIKQRAEKGTGSRPLHDTEQLKGSITVSVK